MKSQIQEKEVQDRPSILVFTFVFYLFFKMLDEIIELLDGEMPKGNEECNFCKFVDERNI